MKTETYPQKLQSKIVYHQYFSEMPCYVSVLDKEIRIVDANNYFIEQFGNCIGDFCWKAYKGTLSKCQDCPVERTFTHGKPEKGQETIKNRAGENIPVHIFTAPLFDEQGAVEKVIRVSADISNVRKLQKKLHRTQQRLQKLFDEVPCYVTVQNRDLHLTSANKRFEHDFGEWLDTTCYEAYKHREEPCLECPVMKTFEDGLSHQSEEVVTSMSGDQYNVLVSTAPLRNDEGEITQVIEMSTNITQIRRLQDQLTSLGLLVGSISHSVKGLLSSLDGGIYLMSSGLEANNKLRINQGWDIIQRNVNRIKSMILDILYYAKDRQLEFEQTDISEFVSEIAAMMSTTAKNFGVGFTFNIEQSLGEFWIHHDAIRSALLNILENAFDSCRKDVQKSDHEVTFQVVMDDPKENIVFEISDNGLGMDRETQEKIFSLFFSSKGLEGTGLGLFISNDIINKHGGRIEVETGLGKGATFRVFLPREQQDSPFGEADD